MERENSCIPLMDFAAEIEQFNFIINRIVQTIGREVGSVHAEDLDGLRHSIGLFSEFFSDLDVEHIVTTLVEPCYNPQITIKGKNDEVVMAEAEFESRIKVLTLLLIRMKSILNDMQYNVVGINSSIALFREQLSEFSDGEENLEAKKDCQQRITKLVSKRDKKLKNFELILVNFRKFFIEGLESFDINSLIDFLKRFELTIADLDKYSESTKLDYVWDIESKQPDLSVPKLRYFDCLPFKDLHPSVIASYMSLFAFSIILPTLTAKIPVPEVGEARDVVFRNNELEFSLVEYQNAEFNNNLVGQYMNELGLSNSEDLWLNIHRWIYDAIELRMKLENFNPEIGSFVRLHSPTGTDGELLLDIPDEWLAEVTVVSFQEVISDHIEYALVDGETRIIRPMSRQLELEVNINGIPEWNYIIRIEVDDLYSEILF